mmetsp:Transcript_26249/g.54896  ORF Transcript_26249/g.54896 Transcript_26249/m.54896 type:complete len:107 (-) Transcript_26249:514-834(-)
MTCRVQAPAVHTMENKNKMVHNSVLAALLVPPSNTISSFDFDMLLKARISRSNLSNRIDGNDRAMEAPAAMRSTKVKSTSAISRHVRGSLIAGRPRAKNRRNISHM